ncbi:GNAT family N-acetyltransferase [Streptomyces sp. NPDC017546]|uniref:GNAT family N-acetyltransferase n=1 Tax=Streptomyces sp. NPDC017546 TaxID=3365001 RepID=UPI0037B84D0F
MWREQATEAAASADNGLFIAIDETDSWAGTTGAAPLEDVPDTAPLHPVYAAPAHCGQDGPARTLVAAATDFARGHTECGRLTLGVREEEQPPKRLSPGEPRPPNSRRSRKTTSRPVETAARRAEGPSRPTAGQRLFAADWRQGATRDQRIATHGPSPPDLHRLQGHPKQETPDQSIWSGRQLSCRCACWHSPTRVLRGHPSLIPGCAGPSAFQPLSPFAGTA